MNITGNEILAKALQRQGVEAFFFLMGGPMTDAEGECIALGMRGIDVRHEQAAAMAAHAYSRVLARPGVCMAASGPGTTNLVTGVANAFVDCCPVIAIGGSSQLNRTGLGSFQDVDQVEMMRPITRWSAAVYDPRRIPEAVDAAFRHAFGGQPGPVYLDLPGDVILSTVDADEVQWDSSAPLPARPRPNADEESIERTLDLLAAAQRPLVITGTGVAWSGASQLLQSFVEKAGIPFYTTPQGRGAVPEDHPLAYPQARSTAFREADLVLVLGTRLNFILGYGRPPRFAADARFVQVDIEPTEIARTRPVEVGIVADVGQVLRQLIADPGGRLDPARYRDWRERLAEIAAKKAAEHGKEVTGETPMHTLALANGVRSVLPRDAYLVVDGREILNFARQAIPTFQPGHRLNSGTLGTMGVGVPFALGAKVAAPDKPVVLLSGDGAFGLNAMEMDTALRHHLDIVCVISNNGGWTGTNRPKAGRDLGFTRYDLMFEAIGCYGEHVEAPADVAPAVERALASGRPAVVNVITDPAVRFGGYQFSMTLELEYQT